MTAYTQRMPSTDDLVGALVDRRYRVLERLAEGGMATVYLALDTRLEREVALKIMRPHLAQDEAFVSRFRREARSAARLSHPGVVAVHDQGEDDDLGVIFLAMEYVPGRTLRKVIEEEGALSPRAALDILEPMLDALAHAHRRGLVHRDVKPENVLIREDGVVKVADFGLARAVTSQTVTGTTGLVLGTVSYMAPEQVSRGIADPRSDVYAAGLLLHEMLTGEKAVDGTEPVTVLYQHVHGELPLPSDVDPSIGEALDDLVAEATERDPDERPTDAGDFLARVRAARRELGDDELDARPGPRAAATALTATAALPRAELAALEGDTGRGDTGRNDTGRDAAYRKGTSPEASEQSRAVAGRVVSHPARRRRRWPWVLVLLSALLAAASGWFFMLGPGAVEQVPTVTNRPVAQAVSLVEQAHLTPRVEERFDEAVPKGVVIATSPQPGQQVRRGSGVTVAVSKGKERYAVPTLAGATESDARDRLTATHLSVGKVTKAWSETVPEGEVISSSPKVGASLKRDAAVALTVSKGRQPIDLPDVTGKSGSEAAASLERLGLKVQRSEANSDTVAKGLVISQEPRSGTLYRGDQVSLVVSKGPVLVKVPNVVGLQVDVARKRLTDAGFKVTVENLFGGIFGTVRFQGPEAGAMAPKGSTIKLQSV